jgi:hypothetical protein
LEVLETMKPKPLDLEIKEEVIEKLKERRGILSKKFVKLWTPFENELFETTVTVTIERVLKEVEKVKKDNPYPEDIFQSLHGKFGRLVWNNCCEELKERILEEVE